MKTVAKNRKARRNYDFEETYEAGLSLKGTEVKSLRDGRCDLTDGYVSFHDEELYLIGARIEPYQNATSNHEPDRRRKLLMHKSEIESLIGKVSREGYSLIPLRIYFNDRGIAKAEIGLGEGLAEHDKREKIKKREQDRRIEREHGADRYRG